MTEYVINMKHKTVHLRVNGMTNERCNVDQIQYKVVLDSNPFSPGTLATYKTQQIYPCKICMTDTVQ